MYSPLISVCIPTYNGQKFLEACLDSAIGQTYSNIEIIVIDDCSTDSTHDFVAKYAAKDARIKLFRNEKNMGLVPNWNKCLELSQGEWIKFLFQDDLLDKNCLEQMLADISDKDKIVVSKRTFMLDNNSSLSIKNYYENEVLTFERLGFKSDASVFIDAKKISLMAVQNICLNFIGEPTAVLFRRDIIPEIGIFNKDLTQVCDLEYFLRVATKYGVKYIPKPLTHFRIHAQSTSSVNISTRTFVLRHMETVITTYQLLYATVFTTFRNKLPALKKYKLKLYFLMHVYEFHQAALISSPENMQKYEDVCKQYPMVEKYKNGSLFIKFIFWMALKRRTLKAAN